MNYGKKWDRIDDDFVWPQKILCYTLYTVLLVFRLPALF